MNCDAIALGITDSYERDGASEGKGTENVAHKDKQVKFILCQIETV
jgi:hypothetical protein